MLRATRSLDLYFFLSLLPRAPFIRPCRTGARCRDATLMQTPRTARRFSTPTATTPPRARSARSATYPPDRPRARLSRFSVQREQKFSSRFVWFFARFSVDTGISHSDEGKNAIPLAESSANLFKGRLSDTFLTFFALQIGNWRVQVKITLLSFLN